MPPHDIVQSPPLQVNVEFRHAQFCEHITDTPFPAYSEFAHSAKLLIQFGQNDATKRTETSETKK